MLARCLEGEGESQPNPGGKWVRQLASPQSCFRCISCPLAIKLTYDFKKLAMRAVAVRDHVQIQLSALPYLWSNFNPGAPSLEGCISWSSDPPHTQNRARTRLLCILFGLCCCLPKSRHASLLQRNASPIRRSESPAQRNASLAQRMRAPCNRMRALCNGMRALCSGVRALCAAKCANPGQRNARLMQLWAAGCEPCSVLKWSASPVQWNVGPVQRNARYCTEMQKLRSEMQALGRRERGP